MSDTTPVNIYAPDSIVVDLTNNFNLFIAIRYEGNPVTDAEVEGRLIDESGVKETVTGTHITDGIYVLKFSDISTKFAMIHIKTLNYVGEAFIQLTRLLPLPIVELTKKILMNNWEIKDNQLIIYDDDGETPLVVFNLYDKLGQPAEMNVYKRVRVQP